ncbi:MAG: methanogenesis marker 3 protein [ANME-2 cluster archaeon]|nr:methanogenesis marker 3 protein [ANME-2 cluster archaeon]
MKDTITVELNERSFQMDVGGTLGELLTKTQTPYHKGTTIGIVKGGEEKEEHTTEYSLKTNKGEFKIEVDSKKTDFLNTWAATFIGKELRAHWDTPDAIAFGPVETGIKPDKGTYAYKRYDIIFGAGGYDAKNTYVIIAKGNHTASHGSPMDGGVFARVISSKNIIAKLEQGDIITNIEPVIKWETLTDKITTTDLGTVLEDGMTIFTYFAVELKKESPQGAEHFLGLVRHGFFRVNDISSSYVVDDVLIGEDCPFELLDSRSEGSVAVRTQGDGLGRVFISKEDRTSSVAHSIVGSITRGIELVKLAEKGNKLAVTATPERVMFLGLNINDAAELANGRGLTLEIGGYEGEDAIIVEQRPETTMEILEGGNISAFCIPPDQLIHIEFYYDKAPTTVEYFKHALKLKERPLGPLPVDLTYENTTLLKTIKRVEQYKEIMPENTPKDLVLAGEVGVTNQASKMYGIIGVKTIDDQRYGPTGEKFHCTNIIGKVIDVEKLLAFNQGDIVYVKEVKQDE